MSFNLLAKLLTLGLFTLSTVSAIGKPMNAEDHLYPTTNQKKFNLKKKTNPKEAYEFTVTLIDPPQGLEAVSAEAHYVIWDCHYDLNKSAGATANFQVSIPIEFKKVSATQYKAVVYFDAMLDEDYLERGKVCHWQWDFAAMRFEPQPNLSMVSYSGLVGSDNKVSDGYYREERYITRWKFNTPQKREKIFSMGTSPDRNRFSEEAKKQLATIRYELRKK